MTTSFERFAGTYYSPEKQEMAQTAYLRDRSRALEVYDLQTRRELFARDIDARREEDAYQSYRTVLKAYYTWDTTEFTHKTSRDTWREKLSQSYARRIYEQNDLIYEYKQALEVLVSALRCQISGDALQYAWDANYVLQAFGPLSNAACNNYKPEKPPEIPVPVYEPEIIKFELTQAPEPLHVLAEQQVAPVQQVLQYPQYNAVPDVVPPLVEVASTNLDDRTPTIVAYPPYLIQSYVLGSSMTMSGYQESYPQVVEKPARAAAATKKPFEILQFYCNQLFQNKQFYKELLPVIQSGESPVCFAMRNGKIVSKARDFEIDKQHISVSKDYKGATLLAFIGNARIRTFYATHYCKQVVLCGSGCRYVDLKGNSELDLVDVRGCAGVHKLRKQCGRVVGEADEVIV